MTTKDELAEFEIYLRDMTYIESVFGNSIEKISNHGMYAILKNNVPQRVVRGAFSKINATKIQVVLYD